MHGWIWIYWIQDVWQWPYRKPCGSSTLQNIEKFFTLRLSSFIGGASLFYFVGLCQNTSPLFTLKFLISTFVWNAKKCQMVSLIRAFLKSMAYLFVDTISCIGKIGQQLFSTNNLEAKIIFPYIYSHLRVFNVCQILGSRVFVDPRRP